MSLPLDHGSVALCCYAVTIALYALHCLRAAARQDWPSHRARLLEVAASVRGAVGLAVPGSARPGPEGFIEECARWHADNRRLEGFRVMVSIWYKFHVCYCMLASYHILMRNQRWMSPEQDVVYIVALLFGLIMNICPNLVTRTTLDVWYPLFIACCTFFTTTMEDPNYMVVAMAADMGYRIAFSTAYMNVPVVVGVNAVHAACTSSVYYFRFQRTDGDGLLALPRSYVMMQIAASALITALAIFSQRRIHLETQHELEIKLFKSEHSAVSVLLDSMCDVVVELDADLTIIEGVPRLSALLMLGSSHVNQGVRLQHFMATDGDRAAFESHLASPARDATPLAGTFHTRMRDSIGNTIDVQVFHVEFAGVDGVARHLVGIREFSDEHVAGLRSHLDAAAPAPPAVQHDQRHEAHFAQHSASEYAAAGSVGSGMVQDDDNDWHKLPRAPSSSSCSSLSHHHFMPTQAESRGQLLMDQMVRDLRASEPSSPRGSGPETATGGTRASSKAGTSTEAVFEI